LPAQRVRAVGAILPNPLSLDAPVHADGDIRVGDVIADATRTSPLDDLSAKELGGRLSSLLEELTPREREILRLRFGIERPDSLTLEEIADEMSLSRERIRQIEVEALAKLRERAADEELDLHLAS
jgi:RNA polymerase primary sigma factor